MTEVLAILCLAVWIYLLAARGLFWLEASRDGDLWPRPAVWPRIVAVVPARNEAECVGACVESLLRQDYAGAFSVVVVDDDSSDDTAAIVQRAAAAHPGRSVTVVKGLGPPPGWTGKLWAQQQGVDASADARPEFLWFTDADIVHAPDTLTWLVRRSVAGRLVLASLMAKLRCVSIAERSHVPAFIYFFRMLFPFGWINRPRSATAAAAGGCMLARADALADAGGIEAIRNALIDDCALAAALKRRGPIWLGLTDRVRSIRRYETLADVRQMVSRSAYAQLRYSPLLLVATTAGLALTFLAPPLLAIFASGWPRAAGVAVWLAMVASFLPMLRFYRLSPLWGIALPGIALLYLIYTLDSAHRHLHRRGGQWKGRVHLDAPGLR
jgi:hopene-associated glycosyltransferase HpnB